MIAVFKTASGALVSVGTVVADPLPAGLSSLDLGSDLRLQTGYGYWDPVTRTVKDVVPSPVDIETNRVSIEGKAITALTGNAAYLGLGSPTNAQNLAQIRALTRQTNGLIKLALNRLDDTAGT